MPLTRINTVTRLVCFVPGVDPTGFASWVMVGVDMVKNVLKVKG